MTDTSPELPRRVSLIAETTRALRDSIHEGVWEDHLPGERDLAIRLQVSRPTVREALTELQREGIIEVTARKKRRIIVSPETSAGRAARARVIAAVSPRPLLAMPPSAITMVDELRTDLARAGFELKLIVNSACFSARPARALECLVSRSNAAAWLIFGSREPMQKWFLDRQLPCLVAGSSAAGIALPSLDIDYRAACRHAGGIFHGKGHRHLALFLPQGSTGGEADSERGFREAIEHDSSCFLQLLVHDATAPHVSRLLDQTLKSKRPPTAILVARAVHTLTVVTCLQNTGLRVPENISVISRDDETFLEHLVPDVSRYAISPSLFTRRLSRAVRQLAESSSLPPKSLRLMPNYIPGMTVGKLEV